LTISKVEKKRNLKKGKNKGKRAGKDFRGGGIGVADEKFSLPQFASGEHLRWRFALWVLVKMKAYAFMCVGLLLA
jgi:hypothetical protein